MVGLMLEVDICTAVGVTPMSRPGSVLSRNMALVNSSIHSTRVRAPMVISLVAR